MTCPQEVLEIEDSPEVRMLWEDLNQAPYLDKCYLCDKAELTTDQEIEDEACKPCLDAFDNMIKQLNRSN